MAIRTLTGTLTIPNNEPSTGGIYDDITLNLYLVDNGLETQIDSVPVPVTNSYAFTFDDLGLQAILKIVRISTGVPISSTPTRGVLPRSFLIPNTDPNYYTDLITSNYTYDAGLSILAASGGRFQKLGKEITDGILKSVTGGTIPSRVNHISPLGNGVVPVPDKYIRTYDIAMVAYSMGYYLEKYPYAQNVPQVGANLYKLLQYLAQHQHIGLHGGLVTAGSGIYSGGTFNQSYQDLKSYTVDNILSYFAFKQAGKVLNGYYSAAASDLYAVIMDKLWDDITLSFKGGRMEDGSDIDDTLETNFLGVYMLKEEDELIKASSLIDRIESEYASFDSVNQVLGYTSKQGQVDVWFEGAYGVAVAYRKVGNTTKYSKIIKELNRFLQPDGSFQFGVIKDGQYQVRSWESVGSTAWSYIANRCPVDVFTVRDSVDLTPGITHLYVNSKAYDEWDNTTCPTGTTAIPFGFWCPVGYFLSNFNQMVVDQNAWDYVQDYGQQTANTYGICELIPLHYNEPQTGTFQKQGCGSGYVGTFVEFEVSGGTFGSMVSVADANAQAIAYINANGQAYANSHGSCVIQNVIVGITIQLTSYYNGLEDEIYVTAYASQPVLTNVTVSFDYGAYGVDGSGSITIPAGGSNTFAEFVNTAPAGQGDYYTATITDITPNFYGNQIYN